jgi:hypothetical protein
VTIRDGQDGEDGENCSVADNANGTYTITCGNDVVTVQDGEDGADGENCTVADNANGTYTLTVRMGRTAKTGRIAASSTTRTGASRSLAGTAPQP